MNFVAILKSSTCRTFCRASLPDQPFESVFRLFPNKSMSVFERLVVEIRHVEFLRMYR